MWDPAIEQLLALALDEDIGSGDVTTLATIPADVQGCATLVAREQVLFCSHEFVSAFCSSPRVGLRYEPKTADREISAAGTILGSVYGSVQQLLTVERTLLNFVQRLSGIARRSQEVTKLLAPAGIVMLDTRKTTPGWRSLEKYAVAFGGAKNHRHGLYDAFLIKNNHIDAVGGDIAKAIRSCRTYRSDLPLEVEVRNLEELQLALPEAPDWILLDNMTPGQICECVALSRRWAKEAGSRPKLEASGGYTPENAMTLVGTDVDAVSMGWLTHSAPVADIALRYVE